MRIVAGSLGGRRLKSPPGTQVRPTPDKVREALFSILADRVIDATVLDLFAGTGALGLEALSRGARFVHFVEQSTLVRRFIRDNVNSLNLADQCAILTGEIPQCLSRIGRGVPAADLIFADPPYGKGHPDVLLNSEPLKLLAGSDCMFVLELPRGEDPDSGLWQRADFRQYGDTALAFYHPKKGSV